MALGLPEFHCRHNYMHLFFTKEELNDHEAQCQKEMEEKEKERNYQQKKTNEAMEKNDEEGLKKYRAG